MACSTHVQAVTKKKKKYELSELRTLGCKALLFARNKSSEMELGCNSNCGAVLSVTSI